MKLEYLHVKRKQSCFITIIQIFKSPLSVYSLPTLILSWVSFVLERSLYLFNTWDAIWLRLILDNYLVWKLMSVGFKGINLEIRISRSSFFSNLLISSDFWQSRYLHSFIHLLGLHCSSGLKNLLAMQQIWVRFPGWGDHLEKGMATHSSIIV